MRLSIFLYHNYCTFKLYVFVTSSSAPWPSG